MTREKIISKKASNCIWAAMLLCTVGILGAVGFQFMKHQDKQAFFAQINKFQGQTAVYEDKVYAPGETLTADWTFEPILWEEPVTMTATFLYKNVDTDVLFVTGQVRILPFFNQLQFQVSESLDWSPTGKRLVTTTYDLPPQLTDGEYIVQICQQFQYGSTTTEFTCYDGPIIEVRNDT